MNRSVNPMQWQIPRFLETKVRAALDEWRKAKKSSRLWEGDAGLWTGADESQWLGWLHVVEDRLAHLDELSELARLLRKDGIRHVLLLGMGGSSLGPEVLAKTFGSAEGFPRLLVLDSTDPAQIQSVEKKVDLAHAAFIVSSKSGGTLEPNTFKDYFFDLMERERGPGSAGDRFLAITDPGSSLQAMAETEHFRHIAFGVPEIGGRFSVLSNFGLLPASLMGMDVARFLRSTSLMVRQCGAGASPIENPGVLLGHLLGVLALEGRDKITFIKSPDLQALGAWLEQLLAESTGKQGRGLIPVDLEKPGPPEVYGNDRVFIHTRLSSNPEAAQEDAMDRLARAGHPVITIHLDDVYDLGQEFFRWEMATAVAGSLLRIHPFDQPDVEASKIATRQITDEVERMGSLPAETPFFEADGIRLYTDDRNAEALREAAGPDPTMTAILKAHLLRIGPGDYFALLAYLEMNAAHLAQLQTLRHEVRNTHRVATCLGFGPRFLHSTGQAYKGGPNTGVFLQITSDEASDLPIPGRKITFGAVKAAQARGDLQVLLERERRALRVHLGSDVAKGLAQLGRIVSRALS